MNATPLPVRILVVEDEIIVAKDIQMQLREYGYLPVGHATRGEDAVALAAQLRPDLVLMDIDLSGEMDGVVAAGLIRSQFSLPVVFLTAYADDRTVAQVKEVMPFGYILKPFSERELRMVLEMALYKHQADLKVQQSEARLSLVIQASRDGIWDEDFASKQAYQSARWCEILGYRPGEQPQPFGSWTGLLHPNDAGWVGKFMSQMTASTTAQFELEFRLRHRLGHYVSVLARGIVLRDPQGQPVRIVGSIRDLTKDKNRQEALRLSEIVLQTISQGVIITSPDHRILSVNPAFTAMTGYTLAEAVGRNYRFLQGPGTNVETADALRQALAEERGFSEEILNYRKDGAPFWNLMTVTPVHNDEGLLNFFVGVTHDITARKNLEVESDRFASIVNSCDEAIVSSDLDGKVTSWNAAAERLFGWPQSQVLGEFMCKIIPVQIDGKENEISEKILLGNQIKYCETVLAKKDGSALQVSMIISAIKNRKGELVGVSKMIRDITALKVAEEIVRCNEKELTDFFEQAPLGLLWIGSCGEVLRINQELLKLLGLGTSNVLGHSVLSLFTLSGVFLEEVFQSLAEMRVVRGLTVTLRPKDGRERRVLLDANGVWQGDRMLYSRWFLRDITDRMELEREILAVGEMERRRLGHDLHDDLCQQLTGIQFLSDALAVKLAPKSGPIANQAKEIAQLTRDAMQQTRELAHGLSPVAMDPQGLMDALMGLAERMSRVFNRSVQFHCPVPVSIPNHTIGIHLYRIAQEAVSNAIKHGKASRVEIRLNTQPLDLILEVEDNGCGMSQHPKCDLGFGLRIMKYRADVISGLLQVRAGPRRGVLVECKVRAGLLLPTEEKKP